MPVKRDYMSSKGIKEKKTLSFVKRAQNIVLIPLSSVMQHKQPSISKATTYLAPMNFSNII